MNQVIYQVQALDIQQKSEFTKKKKTFMFKENLKLQENIEKIFYIKQISWEKLVDLQLKILR